MELIKHPANTSFQYLENAFLYIMAASTATMTVDIYAVRWAYSTTYPLMANLVWTTKSTMEKK